MTHPLMNLEGKEH